MKKKILLIIFSIGAGVLFTIFILNKDNIYAKEEYNVFAFQAGAFENYDNALNFKKKLPSSIIINEKNLYKIYVAMYKDIDIVNKMIVYFEKNNINIYLKSLKINKEIYEKLSSYEKIIKNTEDEKIYKKINQSILNEYKESSNYE